MLYDANHNRRQLSAFAIGLSIQIADVAQVSRGNSVLFSVVNPLPQSVANHIVCIFSPINERKEPHLGGKLNSRHSKIMI